MCRFVTGRCAGLLSLALWPQAAEAVRFSEVSGVGDEPQADAASAMSTGSSRTIKMIEVSSQYGGHRNFSGLSSCNPPCAQATGLDDADVVFAFSGGSTLDKRRHDNQVWVGTFWESPEHYPAETTDMTGWDYSDSFRSDATFVHYDMIPESLVDLFDENVQRLRKDSKLPRRTSFAEKAKNNKSIAVWISNCGLDRTNRLKRAVDLDQAGVPFASYGNCFHNAEPLRKPLPPAASSGFQWLAEEQLQPAEQPDSQPPPPVDANAIGDLQRHSWWQRVGDVVRETLGGTHSSLLQDQSWIAGSQVAEAANGADAELAQQAAYAAFLARTHKEPNDQDRDMYDTSSRHLFFYAAENSDCAYYHTEKVYHGLLSGSIPVYVGSGKTIDGYVPKGSIIKASDFKTTQDLASYLQRVASNETLYNSYFEWYNQDLEESSKDFRQKLLARKPQGRPKDAGRCAQCAFFHNHGRNPSFDAKALSCDL